MIGLAEDGETGRSTIREGAPNPTLLGIASLTLEVDQRVMIGWR